MSNTGFIPRLSQFADSTALADLALPGTHDTMTAACTHPYYRTQELSLSQQLDAGVRFLDLRLRHRPGQPLVAAHREWISEITGAEIFDTLAQFLADHPDEAVIVRCQNANENKDDFPAYGQSLQQLVAEYAPLFWQPVIADDGACTWPTLGQIRGRLVALECAPRGFDFTTASGRRWATHWHGNAGISLQDDWDGPTVADKMAQIRQLYTHADPGKLRLNHISATNGSLGNPAAYAAQLNAQTAQMLATTRGCGVLIWDFATPELIDATWQVNAAA